MKHYKVYKILLWSIHVHHIYTIRENVSSWSFCAFLHFTHYRLYLKENFGISDELTKDLQTEYSYSKSVHFQVLVFQIHTPICCKTSMSDDQLTGITPFL